MLCRLSLCASLRVVEEDISSVIQEALMVAADGLGEAVGATDEYDRDPRSADAEVSKARVILDEYTSSFVAEIYQAKGLEMPDAEAKTYSKVKLAPKLAEADASPQPTASLTRTRASIAQRGVGGPPLAVAAARGLSSLLSSAGPLAAAPRGPFTVSLCRPFLPHPPSGPAQGIRTAASS